MAKIKYTDCKVGRGYICLSNLIYKFSFLELTLIDKKEIS